MYLVPDLANISAQGVPNLDSRPVLETSLNSIRRLRTREWDLTTKYLSKKALKLTDAEKKQIFENFVKGRSRQDFNESCFGTPGTIPGPSPILVFFDNFVWPTMASREPWFNIQVIRVRINSEILHCCRLKKILVLIREIWSKLI
jgi:hypothetical protein